MALQLVVERLARQAERLGGANHAALRTPQLGFDEGALERIDMHCETCLGRMFGVACFRDFEPEHPTIGEIAQLAHVAGPVACLPCRQLLGRPRRNGASKAQRGELREMREQQRDVIAPLS